MYLFQKNAPIANTAATTIKNVVTVKGVGPVEKKQAPIMKKAAASRKFLREGRKLLL